MASLCRCLLYGPGQYLAQGCQRSGPQPALLTMLEGIHSTIATVISPDAIIVLVSASSYVENLALRVFTSADNEDMHGTATQSRPPPFSKFLTFLKIVGFRRR